MKIIVNNPYNLTKENVDITMNKVRAIVLNNLYITIVDYSNILMMPGGKVELGEDEKEALIRELKEELGLDISDNKVIPFLEYNNYLYNYPSKNSKIMNKLVTTKYFIVRTNKQIDLSKNSLTKNEKNQKFNVFNENIININSIIANYNSDNPRWLYFKKELIDILFELNYIFKGVACNKTHDPSSWEYIPDTAIYVNNDNSLRLKKDKKVADNL